MRIIVFVIVFLLFIAACSPSPSKDTEIWCFEDRCFTLTVADSAAERQQGLMFQESLAEDEGMLFVFESLGKHSFWMKNTTIPLDIIWLNENRVVVDLASADPCREDPCQVYTSSADTKYVIEVKRGTTILLNQSEGDRWRRIAAQSKN